MDKPRKTCDTCKHSCYPPPSMIRYYVLGSLQMVCSKPPLRGIDIFLPAPEYKCRDWTQKQQEEGSDN